MKIKIFKNAFIKSLSSSIEDNFDRYRQGNFLWTLEAENGTNLYEIDAPWFNEDTLILLNKISGGNLDEVNDPRDSIALYEALIDMPPELARDGRIWTTLCHIYCIDYIRQRNNKFINAAENENAIKNIRSRFFIENTRSY